MGQKPAVISACTEWGLFIIFLFYYFFLWEVGGGLLYLRPIYSLPLFSSPEPKAPGELKGYVVVCRRRLSYEVNTFKQHLL